MAKKPQEEQVVESAEEVIEQPMQSTAVANFEDKLAKYAAEAAASESIIGTFLSTRSGRLSINQTPVQGNALDTIVIASIYENAYYPGKFDPNNPAPPVCYAFGQDDKNMVPHEDVKTPQADTCNECTWNKWKSDPEGGKGKACKNTRRLALLPADAGDSVEKAKGSDVIYLKLPVTSVKDWGKYVHGVAQEFKRPPFGVVTTITTEPDPKNQYRVLFKAKARITNQDVLMELINQHEANNATIGFPYQAIDDDAVPSGKSEKF